MLSSTYIPCSPPRVSKLLSEVMEQHPRVKLLKNKVSSMRCKFYKQVGHETEDCMYLKKAIQATI